MDFDLFYLFFYISFCPFQNSEGIDLKLKWTIDFQRDTLFAFKYEAIQC